MRQNKENQSKLGRLWQIVGEVAVSSLIVYIVFVAIPKFFSPDPVEVVIGDELLVTCDTNDHSVTFSNLQSGVFTHFSFHYSLLYMSKLPLGPDEEISFSTSGGLGSGVIILEHGVGGYIAKKIWLETCELSDWPISTSLLPDFRNCDEPLFRDAPICKDFAPSLK